jgi:hypothetical protein
MYSLYIGGQLIQTHKELSGLTLINNENARKGSYYHAWHIINPDGSRTELLPYEFKEENRNIKVEEYISNSSNSRSRFVVMHGLCGLVNK